MAGHVEKTQSQNKQHKQERYRSRQLLLAFRIDNGLLEHGTNLLLWRKLPSFVVLGKEVNCTGPLEPSRKWLESSKGNT
jgi:hypothetical protein